MSKLSLAISFYLLFATIVRATDFKYCDENEEYIVKVQGVDKSPIAPGKPVTFSISAKTDIMIERGKLVVFFSYSGVPIPFGTYDLCDETKCPVIGDFLVVHSQVLPGYTPFGTYSLTMNMHDGHGHELTCIKFSFN